MTEARNHQRLVIAIDGPAGAGKSTVARSVARKLGYLYIDTGAMYRAITLKALRHGIDPADTVGLACLVRHTEVRLVAAGDHLRVLLDGEDVSTAIRNPDVSRLVSVVAAVPEVRVRLVELQRAMAADGGVVMDGRDVGSNVLPGADRKFFLTASLLERAARRHRELTASGHHTSLESVQSEIAERDRQDAARATNPLVQAPDAEAIDTTGLTVDQVIERILASCRGDAAVDGGPPV